MWCRVWARVWGKKLRGLGLRERSLGFGVSATTRGKSLGLLACHLARRRTHKGSLGLRILCLGLWAPGLRGCKGPRKPTIGAFLIRIMKLQTPNIPNP